MKNFIILFLILWSLEDFGQGVVKTPLCYGEPIDLTCNYSAGCSNEYATYH